MLTLIHDNTALGEYRQHFELSPHVQFVALDFGPPLKPQIRHLEKLFKRYRDGRSR